MNNLEMSVNVAINNWQQQVNAFNSVLDKLSTDDLLQEVAPNRNRGIYLLGHLVAVHDAMLPLLRFEEALYPELRPVFIEAADKTTETLPPVEQLKSQWNEVNNKLLAHYNALPADEWFTRHGSISEENFAHEPQRNRLNVLLSRTNHLSYHRGQLAFLLKKNQD